MGVGYPDDIIVGTILGIDIFDCVYPTRTAWFGCALTDFGIKNLKKKECKFDRNYLSLNCEL